MMQSAGRQSCALLLAVRVLWNDDKESDKEGTAQPRRYNNHRDEASRAMKKSSLTRTSRSTRRLTLDLHEKRVNDGNSPPPIKLLGCTATRSISTIVPAFAIHCTVSSEWLLVESRPNFSPCPSNWIPMRLQIYQKLELSLCNQDEARLARLLHSMGNTGCNPGSLLCCHQIPSC